VDLAIELIKEIVGKTQKFDDLSEPLLENMKSSNIKVSLTDSYRTNKQLVRYSSTFYDNTD